MRDTNGSRRGQATYNTSQDQMRGGSIVTVGAVSQSEMQIGERDIVRGQHESGCPGLFTAL